MLPSIFRLAVDGGQLIFMGVPRIVAQSLKELGPRIDCITFG